MLMMAFRWRGGWLCSVDDGADDGEVGGGGLCGAMLMMADERAQERDCPASMHGTNAQPPGTVRYPSHRE